MVMGLWNFLLRGSTVTMGLKVALFPRMALASSSGTGWACTQDTLRARLLGGRPQISYVPQRLMKQSEREDGFI